MSTPEEFRTVGSTTVDARRRIVLGKTTAKPGDIYVIREHPDGRIQLDPTNMNPTTRED